jgi:hypothetical protein
VGGGDYNDSGQQRQTDERRRSPLALLSLFFDLDSSSTLSLPLLPVRPLTVCTVCVCLTVSSSARFQSTVTHRTDNEPIAAVVALSNDDDDEGDAADGRDQVEVGVVGAGVEMCVTPIDAVCV